ncbi:MAG: RNA polymerase sigma factor RpoH [Halieaceae bacterium MED-G27]|nr:RNA polymerase sigma factor RpoH [Halieaceae bacterium]OUT65071.1 MAG: RNA polymerase factor sigma-32 [Cellvibrionales bacterium TMED21]PDH37694.1 MAG: RNA polymerase sigma factor RpoH [Halieaceae bacterium MED-G27]
MAPGANLSAYVQTVGAIPMLSQERELELAEKLFYDNCVDSARELVLAHLRFVVHVARTYSGYGLAEADLIQEGNVGLMKAVKRFDPNKGVRLVSFAVHWIKAEMHEYILKNWRIVKVATTKAQRKLFFNLRSHKTSTSWLTEEETLAIANELGVDAHEVTRMEGRLAGRDVAFDMPSDADEDTAWQAPQHYLEDLSANPESAVESLDTSTHETALLATALDDLDERSRDIVSRRWLTEPKATLHELAAEYGVSAERIRQLEANAMRKLRSGMTVE